MKYIYILIFLFSTFAFSIEQESTINKMSIGQKRAKASSMISMMEGTLSDAYSVLKRTRKEKDVIKLTCVNESIRKIKGLLKRSKDDVINLQEAISKSDNKSTDYYYTKIMLANGNVKQAGIEALSCTGTITIEMEPVVTPHIEDLIVEKDYLDEERDEVVFNSNVELEPLQASPYF